MWYCYNYSICTHRNALQEKDREFERLQQPTNKGRGIDEVCKRQQQRKLASLRESTKEALKFADSYHLNLKSVSFQKRLPQSETITF